MKSSLAAKRACIGLLLLLIPLMLAGCFSLNSNESASRDHLDSPASSKAPQDYYTLKLVFMGPPQNDEKLVEDEINEYLEEKIGARLDLVPIDWGQWEDRTNLMIASREKVDIIFTAQWSKHAVNVGKGAFLELSDLLQQYGAGIMDSLDPVLLEGSRIDGGIYGIPTNKEMASQGGIIYRADVADELGLNMDAVHSVADLEEIFKTVKEKKPEMFPIYMKLGETFNAHYIGNYDALGDTSIPGFILKDGTDTVVRPNYEIDRYLETWHITRRFFLNGYINADATTNQTMNMDALGAGNVFAITSSLKPGKAEEIAIQIGMVGKLAQKELNIKTIATSETAGAMLGISSTSDNPVLAMKLINLLHSDAYLNNLLNYGIEGRHYERVGDGVIKQIKGTSDYNPGANWMFGNQFLNDVWDTEAPDKWERFRQFNEHATLSPGLGFVFDSTPVKSEVAAVVNIDRQYLSALDTGSVDIDSVLPDYIQRLKAAGIEVIIKEKQRQFDQFLRERGERQQRQ
ncbi:ABC transporter substrate-binding protein [Paenibacillus sp. CAU 1782]